VPSLEGIFADLKAENYLKQLDLDAFALRAGHYLGEINAVHPFREGNGRT
jgi:cell filamentation protein